MGTGGTDRDRAASRMSRGAAARIGSVCPFIARPRVSRGHREARRENYCSLKVSRRWPSTYWRSVFPLTRSFHSHRIVVTISTSSSSETKQVSRWMNLVAS